MSVENSLNVVEAGIESMGFVKERLDKEML